MLIALLPGRFTTGFLVLVAGLSVPAVAQEWRAPDRSSVIAAQRGAGPVIACTATELAALRRAFRDREDVVVRRVQAATRALDQSLVFPCVL